MKKVLILQIVLCALLLTACGETKEEFNETTVSVGKKGEVTEYIISAFDKDYYKEDELKNMVTKTIDEYNQSIGEENVKLSDFVLSEDGNIHVTTDYNSSADYTNMNGRDLFTGTVAEAKSAGYGVSADESFTDEDKIIISIEAVQVHVPSKIKAVSSGAQMVTDYTAKLPGQMGYVIY